MSTKRIADPQAMTLDAFANSLICGHATALLDGSWLVYWHKPRQRNCVPSRERAEEWLRERGATTIKEYSLR